jgi:hypothetical protein
VGQEQKIGSSSLLSKLLKLWLRVVVSNAPDTGNSWNGLEKKERLSYKTVDYHAPTKRMLGSGAIAAW